MIAHLDGVVRRAGPDADLEDLAANSVSSDKIKNFDVQTVDLAFNAVTSDRIRDRDVWGYGFFAPLRMTNALLVSSRVAASG